MFNILAVSCGQPQLHNGNIVGDSFDFKTPLRIFAIPVMSCKGLRFQRVWLLEHGVVLLLNAKLSCLSVGISF